MAETNLIIKVDPDLKAAFSVAAEAQNRSIEDLLREFMQDYVTTQRTDSDYDQWFRREVQIGVEEADRGEVISGEELEAEFAALRATSLRKLPRSA